MLTATCSPGLNSMVSIQWEDPAEPALVLYVEPGSVAIELPPLPDGDLVLSRFLREVSREAAKLATALEARRVTGLSPDEPLTSRHPPTTPAEQGEP